MAQTQAQEATETEPIAEDVDVDVIFVTGSHIRRKLQSNSASPISVLGSEDITATGAKNVADFTQNMTFNTGAQNNVDAFTQLSTTGTSSMNLRGLGVASTLILINGRRQVLTGTTTNDGLSFVDTNTLAPMIAIDRVEVLKDGASALYGSDAVAGVVNFITRSKFEGLEISSDYQTVTGEGSQGDYNLQGILGVQGDRGGLVAAVSYMDRTPLTTEERRLSRTGATDDGSGLGNPGTFFGVPNAGGPLIDPTGCEEFGGIPDVRGTGPQGDIGFCRFDFGRFFNLVPKESRIQAYVTGNYEITDNIEFKTEFSYARSRSSRGNSASFPNLTFPTVPADNPGNPFGVPVSFFGRALGNGENVEAAENFFESDTWRLSTSLTGELDNGWYWEMAYTRGSNDYLASLEDTLADEFQNSLNGFGGTNCSGPTDNNAIPGQGGCLYFNPFATSFTTIPNDPDVFNGFIGNQVRDSSSRLTVIDAITSGDLFELPSGAVAAAIGVQYREEKLADNYDDLSNQDSFVFLIGNPDFSDSRDVKAAFVEASVPILDSLELQLALRYEDYGGAIGDTLDPKIAAIFTPLDNLAFRGSFSTSFRAPSLFQISGASTTVSNVSDPITDATFFVAVRAVGNETLQPETSEAWNFGISFEPIEELVFDVDYWRFDFSDVIIRENHQAVVNATPQDPTRVIRAGDSLAGPIVRVNVNFANASSVKTDGIDFSLKYALDTDYGTFRPFVDGTYILNYDLNDPQAGAVEGAGNRNFTNFGTSTPQLRFNTGVSWALGAHSINSYVRYIDSYVDDANDVTIGNHTTVDLQYNLNLAEVFNYDAGAVLSIGALNIFDNDIPQVFTNAGFDSKVHDPRGRMVYFRIKAGF